MKKILIINVSRIGDTLLATPAIHAIANKYSNQNIDCLAHPNRYTVLKNIPFINKISSISKRSALFYGWLNLLYKKPYEIAFVYGYDLPLIKYALRVSNKVIAFKQSNEKINHKLYKAVTPPKFQEKHAVYLAMLLPLSLNIKLITPRISYFVSKQEREWAIKIKPTSKHLIGIQTTSFPTKSYRDWPIENFIELCEKISTQFPSTHFIIFGGKHTEERNRTNKLIHSLQKNASNYSGSLTLRETAALMEQIDLFIGVDTGPTHLMSSFNIPMIGLYHCFSPSWLIGPLEHPYAHSIDHPKSKENCTIETNMSDITVNSVFNKAHTILHQ